MTVIEVTFFSFIHVSHWTGFNVLIIQPEFIKMRTTSITYTLPLRL